MLSIDELMGFFWEIPVMNDLTIFLGRRLLPKQSHANEDSEVL
jgi:hypothetical protein